MQGASITTGADSVLYSSFRFILQIVYDSELVSDEAMLKWISLREHMCRYVDDDSSNNKQEIIKLFKEESVQQFVQWIKQIDEDDDEEEDA